MPTSKNNLDNPQTTIDRIDTFNKNRYLKRVYSRFYAILKSNTVNLPKGKKIEIGSGAGFIKNIIPDCITSDIMRLPNCDLAFSAEKIPFKSSSLSAIYLLNTFHHIKNPKAALSEFVRCLKTGGKVIMVEPFNSIWGAFIYKNFHYEGFDEKAGWKIKGYGDLSSANNALPWIIFVRDRKIFFKHYPKFKILKVEPHTPFQYLVSGGFSRNSILPINTYGFISYFEKKLSFLNKYLGMFVTIVLQKK